MANSTSKKRLEIASGNEIRGLMIRLYPDRETEEKLLVLMDDNRRAWNFLVKQREDWREAVAAYAVREKLVSPRPTRPVYDGLSPEASHRAREDYFESLSTWWRDVMTRTRDIPGCGIRKLSEMLENFGCKHDYQMLSRVVGWTYAPEETRIIKPGPHMLQAVTKNFYQKSLRRKRFRRRVDPMPVQVRSGECFVMGSFGKRGGNEEFYNCLVKINGLKIRGRLPGKTPEGRVLQGVSITKKADGWWASIKQEVPVRVPKGPITGSVVGIDVGLDNLVAMASNIEVFNGALTRRIPNTRDREYSERIAGRQAQKLPVGRLQQRAANHMRHLIYNEIIKALQTVETIKVEKLPKHIGQMGSRKVSAMRSVVALLRERYGARVVEVMPHYTSQDCSECGHRCKEAWSYEHGRYGKCPACGHTEDRDINAAKNIAKRPSIVVSEEPALDAA